MDKNIRKKFENRIKKADSIQMIIIIYEILLYYLDTAKKEDWDNNLSYADKCLDELIKSVNFDFCASTEILSVYSYCKQRLNITRIKKDPEMLVEIEQIINKYLTTYKILEEGLPKSSQSNGYIIYNKFGQIN